MKYPTMPVEKDDFGMPRFTANPAVASLISKDSVLSNAKDLARMHGVEAVLHMLQCVGAYMTEYDKAVADMAAEGIVPQLTSAPPNPGLPGGSPARDVRCSYGFLSAAELGRMMKESEEANNASSILDYNSSDVLDEFDNPPPKDAKSYVKERANGALVLRVPYAVTVRREGQVTRIPLIVTVSGDEDAIRAIDPEDDGCILDTVFNRMHNYFNPVEEDAMEVEVDDLDTNPAKLIGLDWYAAYSLSLKVEDVRARPRA